ncbi:endonuclease/exonuclease/phosphatase family protein [Candidatus Woesearchaeota archaeon]|nr:endonuclease/exonuclease/phosphatase family protein [Candidatus Woesearchaeota archaeon]
MKLISLNTWGGKVFEPLLRFIEEQAEDTDVFCFQEMFDSVVAVTTHSGIRANLHTEISRLLPDFFGYFAPAYDGLDTDGNQNPMISCGLSLFLHSEVSVNQYRGDEFVYGKRNCERSEFTCLPRNLQHVTIVHHGLRYSIAHFHGLWNGKGKDDTPDRIEQSRRVRGIFDELEGEKILCGDFNLVPGTESLAILEEDLVNLVTKEGITNTRSRIYYPKPCRYADYVLVSRDIGVNLFSVPEVDVSDHLPLVLYCY